MQGTAGSTVARSDHGAEESIHRPVLLRHAQRALRPHSEQMIKLNRNVGESQTLIPFLS
eukprot:COSAG01_NODE_7173_length_3319_cov_2.638509_1_plen_59_part_00